MPLSISRRSFVAGSAAVIVAGAVNARGGFVTAQEGGSLSGLGLPTLEITVKADGFGGVAEELQTGRIRAALDVFDVEPLPLDHPFRSLPNVILTPHMAGASVQARWRQGDCVVRDLTAVFRGTPMSHEVTLERYPILA